MFGIGPATRIYLAAEPTDMRKSFEGLFGLVRNRLSCDPLSGHIFLFSNAQRDRLKLLFWDGSGVWVCAKRLEKGRFRWPAADGGEKITLSYEELMLLIVGHRPKMFLICRVIGYPGNRADRESLLLLSAPFRSRTDRTADEGTGAVPPENPGKGGCAEGLCGVHPIGTIAERAAATIPVRLR